MNWDKKDLHRVIIFGKTGQGKTNLVKYILKKYFKKIIIFDSLAEYENGIIIENLSDIPKLISQDKFKIIYREDLYSEGSNFDIINRLVYEKGNLCYVVEEVDIFCSPAFIPKSLARIIRYGRHQNISWIFISRRPYDVNRLITSQANRILTFQQTEPRDLDYISRYTSFEMEKEIQTLSEYYFLSYFNNNYTIEKVGLTK